MLILKSIKTCHANTIIVSVHAVTTQFCPPPSIEGKEYEVLQCNCQYDHTIFAYCSRHSTAEKRVSHCRPCGARMDSSTVYLLHEIPGKWVTQAIWKTIADTIIRRYSDKLNQNCQLFSSPLYASAMALDLQMRCDDARVTSRWQGFTSTQRG